MRALALAVVLLALPLAGCLEGTVPTGHVEYDEPLVEGVTDDPGWPALEDATIRPGVLVQAKSRVCPSNFLFARPDNTSLFLGLAAHCVQDMVVGEYVFLDPGRTDAPAMIAYHSWQTMSELGITDPLALEYNDFAVVRVESAFRSFVHPALLRYGGPVALGDATAADAGDAVVTYGEPAPGVPDLGARQALIARHDAPWGLLTYGVPPGTPGGLGPVPGTLGTGVMTPDGQALGVVVSLGVAPNAGTNGVARLDALMTFALEHANLIMDLQTWPLLEDLTPIPDAPAAADARTE